MPSTLGDTAQPGLSWCQGILPAVATQTPGAWCQPSLWPDLNSTALELQGGSCLVPSFRSSTASRPRHHTAATAHHGDCRESPTGRVQHRSLSPQCTSCGYNYKITGKKTPDFTDLLCSEAGTHPQPPKRTELRLPCGSADTSLLGMLTCVLAILVGEFMWTIHCYGLPSIFG